jgi:hypothetical protein
MSTTKTFDIDKKGNIGSRDDHHTIELREKNVGGSKNVDICDGAGKCRATPNDGGVLVDTWRVVKGENYAVEKHFTIDGKSARVYAPATKKSYDYVQVHLSYENGFKVDYLNDSH